MKNIYHLFNCICFLSVSFFYAMECKKEFNSVAKKLDILGEIPTGKGVLCLQTIDEDRAIVFDTENVSSIINFKTNKEIKKLSDFERNFYWRITVDYNNKKTFSCNHMTLLDDIKGKIEEWYTPQMILDTKSILFNPHESALYFSYGKNRNFITKYDHKTKMRNDIVVDHPCYGVMMNSKEKMMYMTDYTEGTISGYEVDGLELHFKIKFTLPGGQSFLYSYGFQDPYVLVRYSYDIFIKDLSENSGWNHLIEKSEVDLLSFHPNGSVLVACLLSRTKDLREKNLMCCWDIKTHEIICIRELDFDRVYRFDISYDGLELIFKLNGKYIRAAVPFEVFYTGKKEEIVYRLCVLQHLIGQQRTLQNVPKEIEQFCAQLLVHAFKR